MPASRNSFSYWRLNPALHDAIRKAGRGASLFRHTRRPQPWSHVHSVCGTTSRSAWPEVRIFLKTTDDDIILIGHSTGGLDIRRLIWDLHPPSDNAMNARSDNAMNARIAVDGVHQSWQIKPEVLLRCIKKVVFLSVPHWGTNIAEWVYRRAALRKTVIRDLRQPSPVRRSLPGPNLGGPGRRRCGTHRRAGVSCITRRADRGQI